ncbi:MAG: hypothetical protein QM724_10425 [Flavobacteriales bacterium]
MEVLQHGRDGYVAVCSGCGGFQVAFGTCLFQADAGTVATLSERIAHDRQAYAGRVCPGHKAFTYDVGSHCMRLVLCHAELERFDDLLRDALWMHGIYASVTDDLP